MIRKKTLPGILLFIAAIFLFENKPKAQTDNLSQNLLRHIVIITFKPGASADSIQALDDVYTKLSKSPLVKDFEMGVSVSARDSGTVKHIYVTTFASKDDMKNYTKIPDFGRLFKISLPIAADVTVADYWAKK